MRIIKVLIFIALASCTRSPEIPPNTLVIGLETGPAVLDPRFVTDAVSTKVSSLIYDGLMKRGPDMMLKLNLAESISEPNPATYVVVLKPGIKFHNGKPLTSSDVVYTINSIIDPRSASPKKGSLDHVLSVYTYDALTLVIRLKKPFAPFRGNLTFGIVPEGSGDLTENPVGTGPFSYASYKRGEKLMLKRNDDYFGGKANLEGVTFKIVPDETVRLLELQKGSIHMIMNPITPAVIPWLEELGNIVIQKKAGTNVSYIGFNMKDEILAKPKVRRAIAHAIDRAPIIQYLLKDLAVETESLIAPSNPFHIKDLERIKYDPDKSRKLLDEAGYPDPGNGKPRFTLTYKTSKNPTRKKIAEIFIQQLRQVGIKVNIKSFEWGTFFSDIKSGNFQMYSLTWVGIADPDIYYYIFNSKSMPPEGANRGRYMNAELDELLEMGRTRTEFEERKKIYRKVQEVIARDMPYVHLWVSVNVAAMNRRVKGFEIYPDESLDSLVKVVLQNE